VTHEALRVLQALEWSERTAHCPTLPMRRIATATLGGNDDLAAKVLADLDLDGCVRTDMMGWGSGWLTSKGRVISLTAPGS
jgi:hypothetical protein